MGDKFTSNACKKRIQNDCDRNLDNSEPFSLIHREAFENFQSGFQPLHDTAMLDYTSQNTYLKGNETQAIDTSRMHNYSQQVNHSHGNQSNSHLRAIIPIKKSANYHKIQIRKTMSISVVGRCIRNAWDVLH
ncbi:hypothetical protein TNCV_1961681 [Trichonephila clavipes]|nr:hypothetical protein TNCV_1961681 [Trichonephila clavipes]